MAAIVGAIAVVLAYSAAYAAASRSVIECVARNPDATRSDVGAVPDSLGELLARGVMVLMTALLNVVLLAWLVPHSILATALGAYALTVNALAAIPSATRNQRYQTLLGWSAWMFPMSWIATAVGAVLFLANLPFALAGAGAIRVDLRTGTIETAGGMTGITGFRGGFSLGNFSFVTNRDLRGSFSAPSLSSHEAGHTLNTAAMGGVVLWINAIDENIRPFARGGRAYGELLAESRPVSLAPVAEQRRERFVRMWA